MNKEKLNKLMEFIVFLLVWLWSISLIIGSSMLIGANKEIQLAYYILLSGFIMNVGLFTYFFWRIK